jgi:stress-induced morphogen
MPIPKSDLENLLKKFFKNAEVFVTDLAGDDDHYKVEIVSDSFRNMSKVQQHQMVYKALNGIAGTTLHAVSIVTRFNS